MRLVEDNERACLSAFQMVLSLRVNQLSMTGAIVQTAFIWKLIILFSYFEHLFVAVNHNCIGEERVTIWHQKILVIFTTIPKLVYKHAAGEYY